MFLASLLLLLTCIRTVLAFPAEDLIEQLPGYDGPLPSKWYSGYLKYRLPALNNRLIHTHYVYVDAATKQDQQASYLSSTSRRNKQQDDTSSPLIFWSNGGPGASSLFGLLTEIGPLMLNDDSLQTESYKKTGIPTLLDNPYSWNQLGSLLIFDAPAPVGYSYCDDDNTGDGLSCGGWDDESSAWNNYHALLAFYDKFPSLRQNPLYLAGESYAGIYVPALARKILENRASSNNVRSEIPSQAVITNNIPLKGFAVGDACTGFEVNCGKEAPYFHLLFFAGHGQISMKMYYNILQICGGEEKLKHTPINELPQECVDVLKNGLKQVGGFFEYSLYDDCTYRNGLLKQGSKVPLSGALNDYVCGGGPVMEDYLRHPAVMEAMHILPNSTFFDGDNGVGFNYTPTEPNLMPFYLEVTKGKYASKQVKVLVYNGDVDPSINSFVAQNWTSNLGLEEYEEWRPWTIDSCKRMGGYVTRYEGNFDFLTIRGAGHMVPTYKPESSLSFLSAWLNNEPYPTFDPKCNHP